MQLVELWSQQTRRLAQANAAVDTPEADKGLEVMNADTPVSAETALSTTTTTTTTTAKETAISFATACLKSASSTATAAIVESSATSNPLELVVSSGGGNLSVGERQLLCLARALVRGAKVLVMDEATANVDPSTDERIQRVIRRELGHATVVTVAHRLATVIYYNLVMVLSEGSLLEFGSPEQLLANPNGHFRALCARTGDLAVLEAEASRAAAARESV